ncbi:Histone-lysine N-methyltransferase, H3 lysine-9 specific SUVH4 [Senna tora]|uniref:Histone-lysine N-methyltransferase, H3 lysine-9 specific SUVH4 n=1 Tax=Senna tora TaxID=362788 RepID=A0A834W0Y3_9FABA|nr:Histone-lysine N-methyltransferase, H3 lysine-9 specific SUVH4 [Senna tora]
MAAAISQRRITSSGVTIAIRMETLGKHAGRYMESHQIGSQGIIVRLESTMLLLKTKPHRPRCQSQGALEAIQKMISNQTRNLMKRQRHPSLQERRDSCCKMASWCGRGGFSGLDGLGGLVGALLEAELWVVNYWAEKGISGFTVYKFRLRRLEGQPTLTTNQGLSLSCLMGYGYLYGFLCLARKSCMFDMRGWITFMYFLAWVHFTNGRVPQSIAEIRGLVCEDITNGQEDMPIPATNLVDDPPMAPTGKQGPTLKLKTWLGFTYRKSNLVSKNVKFPIAGPGCKCKGLCVDPTSCECALRNGSDFPYVSRDGGRLIEAKDVVFECGPNCGCGPGCVNRTSQRGLRYRLEVFRTPKKGWAVRSWDFIPSGAPVCEYTGFLRMTEDMENAFENNYIFEIDCLQTMKGIGGREKRSQDESLAISLMENYEDDISESVPEFCIDAGTTGNIARFINHSCEPNLFVQCVLSSHHDLKLARVMLFAADNIPPLQELTYDYGYALDSVSDTDGKVKKMTCYCGAADCKKRLF